MEPICFFDSKLSDLYFDTREVYLLIGYGNHTPDPMVVEIIDEIMVELQEYCRPRYGYTLKNVEQIDRENLLIDKTTFNPGKIITHAMKEAEQIAVFTATIGSEFDEWMHRLKKEDDMLRTFIGDAIGSVLAEATVALLAKTLDEKAKAEGLSISNSYSPGYCDWMLKEQTNLFSLFPDGMTGIRLTDSCLMLPVKSVSGIIGIGKDVKKRPYGCDVCKMTTCVRNKKKAINP